MYRVCIAVLDATRARLFTYERTADGAGVSEKLTEQRDLVNPARRLRPSELFSETRPSSNKVGTVDDHRDNHIAELDAEFSRAITDELGGLLRAAPAQRLIVCASPKMLGHFRDARRALGDAPPLDEVPRDLVKLTPPQLREQLASYGLLPAPAPR